MLKVLSVDDHAIVREGLRRLLSDQDEQLVFGEAGTLQEARQRFREDEWDLVVLDLRLEGHNGMVLLEELKRERPETPVLVLSMHTEPQYAVKAFKSGASGYVTKGSSRAELAEAIPKVLGGGRYASSVIAEGMLAAFEGGSTLPHETLSQRELEVLRLLGAGRSVTEIAQVLSLSDKTVSTYRARILQKMNLKSTAELIHYAVQNDLL